MHLHSLLSAFIAGCCLTYQWSAMDLVIWICSVCTCLREQDILGSFSTIFPKGDNFVTSCLLSCKPSPFRQGVYKRKEFAPRERKFIPFRVDPFYRRGAKSILTVASLKVLSVPLKGFFFWHVPDMYREDPGQPVCDWLYATWGSIGPDQAAYSY